VKQEETMRVAVFGSGGVGGYFGGRLAQAGEDVIFIARGEHLRAIQKDGLKVESIKGDFQVKPAQAAAGPQEIGMVDVALVAVKAWQVSSAAVLLKSVVGPDTFVVPLSNGVEAPDQLAAILGEEHVFGGLCRISSFIAAPGIIQHTAIDPFVAFGELTGEPSQRAEKLRLAFDKAGVNVQVPNDIRKAMWEKFVFIAAISGMGSVTRVPAGLVRSLPETRALLDKAIQEIAAVARCQGISLADDIADRTLAFIDSMPPHTTASMARDIQEGRPSELESQTGAVVRLARQAGLDTPVNNFIYASLLPQEKMARSEAG
jgi:2-dehydropantoate 2-reductase